jgi:hypothetical protein
MQLDSSEIEGTEMKILNIALIVVFALPALAQTQPAQTSTTTAAHPTAKKSKKKKTAAAAPQPSGPITIPKDAVLDPNDGNYHYTDKSGRKWVYMMTPMGPSRWEDKGPSAQSAPAQPPSSNRFSADPNLKATDQGDTVKFVRTTPFGPQTWTRKKSELTDDERALLANSTPADSRPADKTQN